jgi:general secretion pathway protein K
MKLRCSNSRRGIALIIVMLVIVVLSTLAAGFAFSMKVETRLARNCTFDQDMQWLGRSGVELARYVLGLQLSIPFEGGYDALNQKWAGGPGGTNDLLADISLTNNPLGPGSFSIRIIDLERKVNVNYANRDLLQRAFEQQGFDMLGSSRLVDAIEDWRDPNPDPLIDGVESDYYLSLPKPYVAKDGPIDDLSELLLVRGITPGLYWGSRAAVGGLGSSVENTVPGYVSDPIIPAVGLVDLFNTLGRPQINLNTASAEVLQLLPGVDPNLAMEIVQFRAGPDGVDGTEDDTPFHNPGELINVRGMIPAQVQALQRFCGTRSFTFEVQVRAAIGQYRRTLTAVLLRNSQRDVQVLTSYWE